MAHGMSTPGLSDLWRAVARHKKKSLATFLLVVVLAAGAAIFLPKSYHSNGMLLVRLGRENATLDPTATMGQDPVVTVPVSRDGELNSVVEILKSQAVAEKAVDRLGADFVLQRRVAGDAADRPGRAARAIENLRQAWTRCKDLVHRLEGATELSDRDQAIAALAAAYNVSSARKSDLIQIDCKGPSPKWTQEVVAALMDVYQSEHMRLNRPDRSVEFFTEQTQRAGQELATKQEALRDLKTASGIFSPADQRQTFAARLSRLEEDLLQARAAAKVSETRVAALGSQLRSLPAEQVESVITGIGNTGTEQLRSQLYQLQVRKEEAAAKYTDAHPAKQAIDEQLQASRAAAESQEPTRTHVAKGPSRVYLETQAALLQEQALLAACQAKEKILDKQLAAVRGQTKDFNQHELSIAGLERDIDVCQATYRKYAAGMEQARIDHAREVQRISNIAVAQPATYEPAAVFPRKGIFLGFGVLCGLAAAVGVACRAERRNRSFREPEDVERHLGITVLGTIPHFAAEHFAAGSKRGT